LAENYLIDMDGVLVHEDELIPGAEGLIKRLQEAGRGFLVLTNNSIYTPRDLVARLRAVGIDVPPEAIWTSALATARFLDDQRSLPFSYPEVGASRVGAPPGYPVNQLRGRLGAGRETFARAVEALRSWKMYETGWTKLCWPEVPITEGTVVGILGRHFGLWSLNACRIAYTIEEEGPPLERYGFAFGTLPAHVERGEERSYEYGTYYPGSTAQMRMLAIRTSVMSSRMRG
jgi:uncharacterized protein (UPF0548 family)